MKKSIPDEKEKEVIQRMLNTAADSAMTKVNFLIRLAFFIGLLIGLLIGFLWIKGA